MATSGPLKKKPRIRKSPPTVRQRMETATAAANADPKPKKVRRAATKAASPFKRAGGKLKLRDRKAFKAVAKVLKPVFRPLRWLGRHLIPRYLVNSWREVRQVQWPARKETWRLTLAVFIFSIVFGAIIAGVDKGLDEIFKKVVLK